MEGRGPSQSGNKSDETLPPWGWHPFGGESGSKIYAVRTPIGREGDAAEMISSRARYKNFRLKAVLISPETDGYIFVEAPDVADVLRATEDVRLARNVVEGPASGEDVERLLNPRPPVAEVSFGDAVEIIGGEFEGEKGRITNISHSEGEATVKLETGVVPFSVTVGVDVVEPVTEKRG